ncbi:trypsin-like peptidase domain-containing protein (plasmid) [Ensifer sp. PDNC004]|uniref:trypsin-like peptidase domain-containing protein n=1 Tax=Ensifer sp. PDNC004 TaxID=2811423 RepID=UPI00196478D4|nr:trypsin-like peptidase domain-containing protein [Ensifer sp. PDNC004]QRY70510.1 trypsin-like peptidase domain-containing protein [Ensifer sp. PDNC004]
MQNLPCFLLATAIYAFAASPAAPASGGTGFSDALSRVRPAVVGISSTASRILTNDLLDDANVRKILGLPDNVLIVQSGSTIAGSGIIIDAEQGYIVTNSHVIADADDIAVTLNDGRVLPAEIVGSDQPTDLAVIRIAARGLVALGWGRSSVLNVGDFVVAVGSPLGLEQTASFGIISGLSRSGLGIDDYEDYIQTDAALNPGNSGGALVNAAGELLGVVRGAPPPNEAAQGVGFVIPSDFASKIVRALIKDGVIKRGWLGVSVTLSQADDKTRDLVVHRLSCNSAAERQGVRLGDAVTALNGHAVSTEAAFKNAVSLLAPDAQVTLDIRREGRSQRLELKLLDPVDVQGSPGQGALDTVTLALPGSSASRACTPKGPVLMEVPSDSVAYAAGLRSGDYLTSINGEPPVSASRIQDLLDAADGKVSFDILRAGTAYRFVVP